MREHSHYRKYSSSSTESSSYDDSSNESERRKRSRSTSSIESRSKKSTISKLNPNESQHRLNRNDSRNKPKRSQNINKYSRRKRSRSTSSIESYSKKSTISKSPRNESKYRRSRFNLIEESYTGQETSIEDAYGKSDQKNSERLETYKILPEDDPNSSRILYIGNLDTDITSNKLHTILERYGHVIRVDVMPVKSDEDRKYAFVKFLTLNIAYKAKVALFGHFITKYRSIIGYGHPTPTERIWIGNLESSITTSQIKSKFRNFGEIKKMDHSEGDDQCYIKYDSVDSATRAIRKMRGFLFAGSKRGLRTDYADIPPNDFEDRRSDSTESNNLKKFEYGTVQEIMKNCSMVWLGNITLNNLPDTLAMYLIEGDENFVDELMKNENGELQLTISQMYSQSQFKSDQVERGLHSGSSYAIFLAASVSENTVWDLKEQKAVGAVHLINKENFTYGILFIFTPCTFSIGLLKRTCPYLSEDFITDQYKIIVGLRGY